MKLELQRGSASCSVREALVFGAVAVAVAFALYGRHVVDGGFILDDWAFAAEAELYGGEHGFASLVERLRSDPEVLIGSGGRPVAALYFAATHLAFELETALHIGLAVALAALVSTLFYAVLRTLTVERLHAALLALLVLVFPAADASRLWPAAAVGLLGLVLYLGGLLLALRGLRHAGRAAVLLHAGAVVFYALSLLTYEVAAAAIAMSVLVYRLRAPWRASVYRWLADLALVVAVAVYVRASTAKETAPLDQLPDRVDEIQAQARTLFAGLGVQDGEGRLPVPLAALVLVVALVVWRLLPKRDAARAELARWLIVALAGILVLAAGYAPFVPANDPQYVPLMPGLGNRVNVAAAFGYVLLIYALAMLVGTLVIRAVTRVRPLPLGASGAVGVLVSIGVAVLWVGEVNQDRRAYERAYALERETLDVLRDGSRPAPGTTIFTFGQPGETAPFIPAFSRHWDLTGAVRLVWSDASLRGIPGPSVSRSRPGIGPRWGIVCSKRGAQPVGVGWNESDASPYGRTLFVHVPDRRLVFIHDRGECQRSLEWVTPTLEAPYQQASGAIASP